MRSPIAHLSTYLVLILVFSLGLIRPVSAAQVAVVNPADPDEVKVRNENGVMYLTTETNQPQTVPLATPTPSTNATSAAGNQLNASQFIVVVPTGFARSFAQLVNFVLRAVLAIAALLVFTYLIMGAFNWITSGGEKGKTEKARNQIAGAVIGILIVAASYAIINLVVSFLGFGQIDSVLQNVQTINSYDPAATPSPTPSPTAETDLGPLIEVTPTPVSN